VQEFALALEVDAASIPLVAQARVSVGFVINLVVLAALVAAAVVAILWVRSRWLGRDGVGGFEGTDGEELQNTLLQYRNLRDEGVLSEEEFRRIRTLVGPRLRPDSPELHGRQRPPTDPIGPTEARD
jgi:hypothetical protein